MNLSLENVSLSFNGKTLFRDLDLTIAQGDFLVIRGVSGSGKTSLLRLLNRLAEPDSGVIAEDGTTVTDLDVTRYRRRIGYIQQTPVMVAGSVLDNLALPFTYGSATSDTPDRDVLESNLADFNLDDVALEDDAEKLSVGQKQRVALIRTLLTDPDIILGDEPTSALDPESRRIVEDRLRRVNRESGKTVVLVTHLDFDPGDIPVRDLTLADGGLVETPS